MPISPDLRAALAACEEDRIIFDLAGIEERYDSVLRELPGVAVRFAMKACPVDAVIAALAARGAGIDAASPQEIAQAIGAAVPVERIHYGNTAKSDRNIADAFALGVRDFATDSVEDLLAIATYAPGARVFCRLATSGDGALWGLSRKFGCSAADAVVVLETARDLGLTPAGLSVHVGSQQMSADAWHAAFDDLADTIVALDKRGILLDHVNLGGGLPALGYLDAEGEPMNPPLDKSFATIREGMQRLAAASESMLDFIIEPGRYLVADHGAIRAHVTRLSTRQSPSGEREHWLYLSCGRFNGLYEADKIRFPLVYPTHQDPEYVPAFIAGPTCDSDDVLGHAQVRVKVPRTLTSGDPVWIASSGAYAVSYATQGFNGFKPFPCTTIRGARIREIDPADWDRIVELEAEAYAALGLSESREALISKACVSPESCFVLDLGVDQPVAGYVLAIPYPPQSFPDLGQPETKSRRSANLHLHDIVIAEAFRGRGLAKRMLRHLMQQARDLLYERISLVAVGSSDTFWAAQGFRPHPDVQVPESYGPHAVYMSKRVQPQALAELPAPPPAAP
jgi:diaminopimelate decarboxylase/ribosomal protein S18 acetylase RimI-like enzyme